MCDFNTIVALCAGQFSFHFFNIDNFYCFGHKEDLTYGRHRQSHRHGDTDEEGRQEDLREEALGVPLGAVEPLDDETVELTELQPPAV